MILIDCVFAFKCKFQIMHKFRGALSFHILLKSSMLIIDYIFCWRFDLYVVINYQKGGDWKHNCSLGVVLIIDHNICIIGLMCFPSIFQKKIKRCYGLRFMCRCPWIQERNNIGSSFKLEDSSFYIFDKTCLSP